MRFNQPMPAPKKHCRAALILIKPFCEAGDLMVNGSHHQAFWAEWPRGVPDDMKSFLSSVQKFCNSTCLPALEDPIRAGTVAFVDPHGERMTVKAKRMMMFFHGMFDVLSAPVRTCNKTREDGIPSIWLDRIKRDRGRRCGFVGLPPLEACVHDDLKHHLVNPDMPQAFIVQGNNLPQPDTQPAANTHGNRDHPSPHRLMQLTCRNTCRHREGGEVDTNVVDVVDGLSILQWSEQEDLSLDDEQRVSFHTIVAAFILTHFNTASWTLDRAGAQQNEEAQTGLRHAFMTEKRRLRQLTRLRNGEPLRMFMDGAGGAGKSRVVDKVIKCAEAHTGNLGCNLTCKPSLSRPCLVSQQH